jgi:hypothetical protein
VDTFFGSGWGGDHDPEFRMGYGSFRDGVILKFSEYVKFTGGGEIFEIFEVEKKLGIRRFRIYNCGETVYNIFRKYL